MGERRGIEGVLTFIITPEGGGGLVIASEEGKGKNLLGYAIVKWERVTKETLLYRRDSVQEKVSGRGNLEVYGGKFIETWYSEKEEFEWIGKQMRGRKQMKGKREGYI